MQKRNSRGLRLLRVALDDGRFEELASLGIHQRDFTEDAGRMYDWIVDHSERFGSFPTSATCEDELGVKLPPHCEFQLAFEQYQEHLLEAVVRDRTRDIVKFLERGEPKNAAALFRPIEYERPPVKSFESGKFERYAEYEKRRLSGIQGIDIPWPSLENILIRWENSTLNVLLAMSNTGKTWLSCFIAAETMKVGKKVLLVSMENPLSSIGNRLDSLIFKVPFDDMRMGNADMRIEKRWRNKLDKMSLQGDIILADQSKVKTPSDVAALVRSEKPDLVIVDGAYMLDGASGSKYESTASVVESCQRFAQSGIPPWICTSQLNPPKNKTATGYDRGYEARGAKEWMFVPSTGILLLQDSDDRLFNRARIMVSKIREAGDVSDAKQEFFINSNRVTMDFSELAEDVTYDIEY